VLFSDHLIFIIELIIVINIRLNRSLTPNYIIINKLNLLQFYVIWQQIGKTILKVVGFRFQRKDLLLKKSKLSLV
jgi:uncharacterized membrane protein YobD (UPF0266 family)